MSQPTRKSEFQKWNPKTKKCINGMNVAIAGFFSLFCFAFLIVLYGILVLWVYSVLAAISICQPYAFVDISNRAPGQGSGACGCRRFLESSRLHLSALATPVAVHDLYQVIPATWQQVACRNLAFRHEAIDHPESSRERTWEKNDCLLTSVFLWLTKPSAIFKQHQSLAHVSSWVLTCCHL